MIQIYNILVFIFVSLTSFLITNSSLNIFIPQIIALISIIFIFLSLYKRIFSLHLIAFIINLIVFDSQGLNSPFFFLIYFLLFTIAFQNPPTTTLSYSLILILLLSTSLDFQSFIPLISLLFITPLAWFIGKQYLDKKKTDNDIKISETNILLWLSLKFKTGISQIIDNCAELLSTPLQPTQKEKLKYIKDSAKSLLNSSEKLKKEIDNQTDEEK